MINAVFNKTDGHFNHVVISGHAGFADYGKDIVCSAVTTAFFTSVNLIDRLHYRYQLKQDEGFLDLVVDQTDDTVENILQNLFDVLKSIEEDYSQNVKVI
jgi:uncharacterized protein YsxB (DUF464 family)